MKVRIDSDPRRRKTQTLAPTIAVFLCNKTFSNRRYRPAGAVERAKQGTTVSTPTSSQADAAKQPTSNEQRNGSQRAVLSLKSLQQRRQSQHIQQHMEEPDMNKRIRIKPIHYRKVSEPTQTIVKGSSSVGTYWYQVQSHPESATPIVQRPRPSVTPEARILPLPEAPAA